MLKNLEDSPLHRIANPRSIVFFGASNNISSMGTNQLASIQHLGYEGRIYPVHPKEKTVRGLKAYASVLDLPEAPDLAVMVLPARAAVQVLDECGRKGVKQAIIVSGGFAEVGGEGATLQDELKSIARRHGISFLGPNCIGAANPHCKLNTTFMRYRARPGFIGMASQSGSFVTQMFDYLDQFGLGFSTALSVGNEAVLDLVDCLEYLALEPHTKVITLYIEAIRRGPEFIRAARAIVPHKPIVAYYVGGSEAGRQAGLSHTGALAGSDRLYDGILRQCGIVRAETIEQMFDFAWALALCPPLKGRRVMIQTHSGGPGAAAADACGREGLTLPAPTRQTREAMAPIFPHTGSLNNPVDLTYTRNPLDYTNKIPGILLADQGTDALMAYLLAPNSRVRLVMKEMGVPEDQLDEEARKVTFSQSQAVAQAVHGQSKPFIGFTFRNRQDLLIRDLQDQGVVVLPSPARAARALAALARLRELRAKLAASRKLGQ